MRIPCCIPISVLERITGEAGMIEVATNRAIALMECSLPPIAQVVHNKTTSTRRQAGAVRLAPVARRHPFQFARYLRVPNHGDCLGRLLSSNPLTDH